MVRPSDAELDNLRFIAQEILETAEAEGYLVGEAIALHSSFRTSRRPSSSLARQLIMAAARRAAVLVKMYPEDTAGGGMDLVSLDGTTQRRYRVKRADKIGDGRYDFICGAGSSLLTEEPETIFRDERWILGFTLTEDFTIDEVFAAQVIGFYGEGPVHLTLGEVVDLTGAPTPPMGFTSSDDDDLPGFENDDEDGEEYDAG